MSWCSRSGPLKSGYGLASTATSASRCSTLSPCESTSCTSSRLRARKKSSATGLNSRIPKRRIASLYSEAGRFEAKADGCQTHATRGSTSQTPSHTSCLGAKSSMWRSPSEARLRTRFAPIRIEPSPPTHSSITSFPLLAAGSTRASVPEASRSPPERSAGRSGVYSRRAPVVATRAAVRAARSSAICEGGVGMGAELPR
mmetsp:Transcript_4140/g.13397  ORF Transcript_4140/g.13397 Transcript_4140/m.13397 type:complete len:200 (+) Transcript_4140:479-1078(+)